MRAYLCLAIRASECVQNDYCHNVQYFISKHSVAATRGYLALSPSYTPCCVPVTTSETGLLAWSYGGCIHRGAYVSYPLGIPTGLEQSYEKPLSTYAFPFHYEQLFTFSKAFSYKVAYINITPPL